MTESHDKGVAVLGIVALFVELPQILGPESEVRWDGLGLVPEHTVPPVVSCRLVMDVERRIITGHLIHDTTKGLEVRDDTRVILPQHLAVSQR